MNLDNNTDSFKEQLEKLISDNKQIPFEEQFKDELQKEKEEEEAYFASIPSTEEVQEQLEKLISDNKQIPFEEQFKDALQKEKEQEEAYFASIQPTKEVQKELDSIIKEHSEAMKSPSLSEAQIDNMLELASTELVGAE